MDLQAVSLSKNRSMKFTAKDFGHLKYDPFRVKMTDEVYKGLMVMESWGRKPDRRDVREKCVVEWVFMMYQVGSPLLNIQNLVARKVEAADLAGFDRDGGDYGEGYKRIMAGEDEFWNRRIVDFCRVQNEPDFAEYVVYEEIFYRQLGLAKGNTDPQKIKGMLDNVQGVKKKMGELQKSLMFGDDTRGLIKAFLEEVSFEGVRLRREDIAHALKDGADPLGGYSPYGEYEVIFAPDVNKERYAELKGGADVQEG